MATEYVVLTVGENNHYFLEREGVVAATALAACRTTAEDMSQDSLDKGVTLIAIPARNWRQRHTLKAETTRRIRSA